MSYRTQAGVYRVDITAPAGISMSGYFARAGVSEGYGRPLTAIAVVLAGGGRKVAVLGCDVIAFTTFDVDEIRAAIAASIGTTVDSVLINTSHTHCGPTLTDYSWEPEDQKQIQRACLANLKRLLTGCAVSADRRLQPARLGTANGSSHIGINRREFDPESGKVILGENPNGPMDPTVGGIRIDDLGGRPMAILFSYGCHTVTMGPKYLLLSPDFPGPARDVIERATGALAIFLQAAGGNINPIRRHRRERRRFGQHEPVRQFARRRSAANGNADSNRQAQRGARDFRFADSQQHVPASTRRGSGTRD